MCLRSPLFFGQYTITVNLRYDNQCVTVIVTCVVFSASLVGWILTLILVYSSERQTERKDKQTDRQSERGKHSVLMARHLAEPFPLKRLTVFQSHIYKRKGWSFWKSSLSLLLLEISGCSNESCCPTGSNEWVTKFKVLLIRFHQFSPSQFKAFEKKREAFFFSLQS